MKVHGICITKDSPPIYSPNLIDLYSDMQCSNGTFSSYTPYFLYRSSNPEYKNLIKMQCFRDSHLPLCGRNLINLKVINHSTQLTYILIRTSQYDTQYLQTSFVIKTYMLYLSYLCKSRYQVPPVHLDVIHPCQNSNLAFYLHRYHPVKMV